jgi:hypothetical protein
MAWQTPKTNWQAADVVSKDDFNRIEGNVQELQNTKETPAGAQAKANTAEANAKAYTDAHVAESAIHKTSDVIRTETETKLKVEVVSSSVSETPDAGRIIFDTSQGKFFGGNGTEWV